MWRIRTPLLVAAAVAGGVLWWWAVLRLALVPGRTGVVEGAVAVGGWGLSLLPVHCVPLARAAGVSEARRRGEGPVGRAVAGMAAGAATRAWRRRRSGGGSARS
ncbi:hypothetical protein LG634_31725 [Streptomyces bambusae]|uniref:hypothetical protein n=1 Tax=Streptomyces bambusae TaxID=1550616 RepID=UPI001CFFF7C0|nr:hypothetical protein [Streptomyces bambusae]MCB5169366.1 hypothetical protein [Streptomyces bambusae]